MKFNNVMRFVYLETDASGVGLGAGTTTGKGLDELHEGQNISNAIVYVIVFGSSHLSSAE